MNKIILSLLSITLLSSCYYDHEEALYPQLSSNCDTTNVTYTNTIQPILQENCTNCHSSSTANSSGSGYVLDNYNDVKSYSSLIIHDINLTPGSSPNFMPSGSSVSLSTCNKKQIQIWVNSNMPQ